jgi:hypothetical protein
MSVYRTDLGYTERYYGLYNVSTNPAGRTPAGWYKEAGQIVQVIHAGTSTTVTNSTGTAIDTGLTATITPTSATSKILVLVSQNGMYTSKPSAGAFTAVDGLTLFGNATGLINFGNLVGYTPFGNETFHVGYSASLTFLDSPGTTSAITYKTRFYNYAGTSGTTAVQAYGSRSTITLMEISA